MEEEIKKLKRQVNRLQEQVALLLSHYGLSDLPEKLPKVERVKETPYANVSLDDVKHVNRLRREEREARDRALAESMKP